MEKQKWTIKDKIACSLIFAISVIVFVSFFATMTLSYFYDTHEAIDTIAAGKVDISLQGGYDGVGTIKFPEIISPNSYYSVNNYLTGNNKNLTVSVVNKSTSGPVFVMITINSSYLNIIKPVLTKSDVSGLYWMMGESDSPSVMRLYYMYPLNQNEASANFCTAWTVGNFTDPLIQGELVTMKIKAEAIQAQGGAVLDMIDSDTDNVWKFAPTAFVEMVTNYSA